MNQEEDNNNFKLDIKETLLRNFLWIPMFISVLIFAFIGISQAPLIENENLKIMFLIFDLFITLKLVVWVGHPSLVFREKEKEEMGE